MRKLLKRMKYTVYPYRYCKKKKHKHNFQQWISWLAERWRTQLDAIRNVNCTRLWIIKSLNASCAASQQHACLSDGNKPFKTKTKKKREQHSPSNIGGNDCQLEIVSRVNQSWCMKPARSVKIIFLFSRINSLYALFTISALWLVGVIRANVHFVCCFIDSWKNLTILSFVF